MDLPYSHQALLNSSMCEQTHQTCDNLVGSLSLLRHPQVGIQGDLWIIGAQNAGKSSVINTMKYHAGTRNATAALTTAPLPGTTLDMVMVEGLPLMARSRCYDTPGVPHPYQLTSMFGGTTTCPALLPSAISMP